MFAPQDLTEDGFLDGRVRALQPKSGYRAATDPVFLAAAVAAEAGQSVLDLGCGAGVASLCLGARVPGLTLNGLELQPAYADLARRNATLNSQSFEVVEGDLAAMPHPLRARAFDHVLMNPPYFLDGSSAQDPGRETARREQTPLGVWIEAGLRKLRPGGWLTIIQSADRLADVLLPLTGKVGAISILPLQARPLRPALRVILRARKGARGPLRLAGPLVIHDGLVHLADGDDYTDAARAILRRGERLDFFATAGTG